MNSSDFDDLFKRASEKYPLRTDSADWNKIARALDDDPSLIIPPVVVKEDKRKRRRLVWLFFILPLALLGYFGWNNGFSNKDKMTAGKSPVLPYAKKEVKQPENKSNNADPNVSVKQAGKQYSGKQSVDEEPVSKVVKDQQVKDIPGTTAKESNSFSDHTIATVNTITIPYHSGGSFIAGGNHRTKGISLYRKQKVHPEKTSEREYAVQPIPENKIMKGESAIRANIEELQPWQASGEIWDKIPMNPPPQSLALATVSNKNDNSHGKTASKTEKHRQSYFYTGVMIAPDISTIKFQSVKGTGYTVGIILGYSLSSKFALETGIYLDSKKYYTNGEYFSTKNLPISNYVDLLKVDGTCNMIEVPLNLRYNLHTNTKTSWFVITGLSTYFMFKEGYNYSYLYYGNPREKYYSTTKSSQYWFSILNISAGYEHHIGKIGNLRLEPYVRVPLTGMGTGSLPIMSAGLNIGITHRIK